MDSETAFVSLRIDPEQFALMVPAHVDRAVLAAAIEAVIDGVLVVAGGYYGGAVELQEVDDETAQAVQDD